MVKPLQSYVRGLQIVGDPAALTSSAGGMVNVGLSHHGRRKDKHKSQNNNNL